LRTLTDELAPEQLEPGTMAEAVRELVARSALDGVEVSLEIAEDTGLGEEQMLLVYRVIREGLHNVVRHADATRVWIRLQRRADDVVVSVEDDGVGPTTPATPTTGQRHWGLRLLAHAVAEHGGRVDLGQREPTGARLVVTLPLGVGQDARHHPR
jgi:signal transduction histidine kinase